jgi:hypothetical protein
MSFTGIFGPPKNKEKERFYLLPGMGGRNLWRKQKVILRWTALAGLLISAVVGLLLYWMGMQRP